MFWETKGTMSKKEKNGVKSQPLLTCSKSTTETSEQYPKSVQSQQ